MKTVDYEHLEENIKGAFLEFLKKGGFDVNSIEELGRLRHNPFCAALTYVGDKLFRSDQRGTGKHSLLPYTWNNDNIYILNNIINIYINLCYLTDNDCSMSGLCCLTAYEHSILYKWRSDKLNPLAMEELQNVRKLRQEMVEHKLSDHPIGNTALANNSEELGLKWTVNNQQNITKNTVFVLPGERVKDSLQGASMPRIDKETM